MVLVSADDFVVFIDGRLDVEILRLAVGAVVCDVVVEAVPTDDAVIRDCDVARADVALAMDSCVSRVVSVAGVSGEAVEPPLAYNRE